jgi:hypothetical protein
MANLKGRQPDNAFFMNKKNEIQYNKTCEKCKKKDKCGVSFRAEIVACPVYEKIDKVSNIEVKEN